jgi:hypothetical protein
VSNPTVGIMSLGCGRGGRGPLLLLGGGAPLLSFERLPLVDDESVDSDEDEDSSVFVDEWRDDWRVKC